MGWDKTSHKHQPRLRMRVGSDQTRVFGQWVPRWREGGGKPGLLTSSQLLKSLRVLRPKKQARSNQLTHKHQQHQGKIHHRNPTTAEVSCSCRAAAITIALHFTAASKAPEGCA